MRRTLKVERLNSESLNRPIISCHSKTSDDTDKDVEVKSNRSCTSSSSGGLSSDDTTSEAAAAAVVVAEAVFEDTTSLPCHCTSCLAAEKMKSPPELPDEDPDRILFPDEDEDTFYGNSTIPRAHLSTFVSPAAAAAPPSSSSARPPLPLPAARIRHESGNAENHYYASAGTLLREAKEIPSKRHAPPAPIPPPPPHVLPTVSGSMRGGPYGSSNYYMMRVGGGEGGAAAAATEVDDVYATKMSQYIKDTSKKHSQRKDLEGLVAAIGFIGIILSVAALLAYFAVQAPYLRKSIGPAYASDYHNREKSEDAKNAVTLNKLQTTANVLYGIELACSIILGVLMVLTDALLIHGVRKKSAAFLLPWLMVKAFFLAVTMASTVAILALVEPAAFKGLCLVPAVLTVLVFVCWVKVFRLYKISKNQYKPPKVKRPFSHYSPYMTRENPYVTQKSISKTTDSQS